jgi:hypothetical protein
MSDKDFNNFQSSIALRRAISLNKIDIKDDPLYTELESARLEKTKTKYAFIAGAVLNNLLILYASRYKTKNNWYKVIGTMTAICFTWNFFYWISPGVKRHSEAVMNMSKLRKEELKHTFEIN